MLWAALLCSFHSHNYWICGRIGINFGISDCLSLLFCSYNHKIKNTLPLSNTLIMNHLLPFLLRNLEAVHSPLFPKTNSFSSRGPPAMCLIPGWNTWQLSALQIKFFIPSLLSNTKHRTFIHTDWTRTYMNWTREQIGAPDIRQDTKGNRVLLL